MAAKRISMRHIKDVLRLTYEAGLSQRQIAKSLSISLGAVSEYLKRTQEVRLNWPLPDGLSEIDLARLLFPKQLQQPVRFAQPDCSANHTNLKHKGVTLQLLWQEYKEVHGDDAYRYTQFCHHFRKWRGQMKRSMRQTHKAGEKCFVYYCGPTIPVINASTSEIRQAQIFVAVLGASNYTYTEANTSIPSARAPS